MLSAKPINKQEVQQSLRTPIVLRTKYSRPIAAEPNRRQRYVWNSHSHMTTLPVAIPDAEISALRFSMCVVAERYILQQKCLKK